MDDIKLCSACDGTGEIREDVGYHHSEYEYHTCRKCNGTGRVIVGTYQYTVPYGTDRSIIYKFDSEIHKLLRELEQQAK